jgi:flagellin
MSIKVSANSTLKSLMSNLRKASEKQEKVLNQLSSGKRISKSSDDSAGIAHATKLNAFIRSQKQASRNANDGISFVQTAEGGLNEVSNILTRLRELSVQAGSDTVGEDERGFLNKEYQSLKDEIDRIAESTSFNGTNVINGDGRGVLEFQVGAYSGEANTIKFDTEGNYTSVSDLDLAGAGVSEKEEALDSISSIDDALNKVSSQRSYLGSIQSRMQHAANNLETNTINHQVTKSKIEDVDVAQAAAEMAITTITQKAAVQTLTQAMNFSKASLKLIS